MYVHFRSMTKSVLLSRSLSRFEHLEGGPGYMEKPLIVIDFYRSPGPPSTRARGVGDQHAGAKRIGSNDSRSFLKQVLLLAHFSLFCP
jgi:hypothetical protein